MIERVNLRIDGRVVEVTLIEKPYAVADDGAITRYWAVEFDEPIAFEEHSAPKVEVSKHGVWVDARWESIPAEGGSNAGFIAFTDAK